MSQPTSKLNHRLREEVTTQQQFAQGNVALEFATAEEMLRADAAQTAVPPAVVERLQKSIDQEPRPARSWWQRLFEKSAD